MGVDNQNQWLVDAIETLKAKRLIDKNIEIARATGVNGSTLSNYMSGKFKTSFEFKTKFLEYYGKSLDINARLPIGKGIPFYNMDVSASNVDVFNDVAETSVNISVPGFSDCEFAFPIYGHSMYPIYESGCIIICKRISDLDVINYGEAYLIITKEQRMLKRVQLGSEPATILLTSDNNEKGKHDRQKYESFELKKDKIKHLFLVKGSIKRNQI